MGKKNYKETYFQHDRYARQDSKIKSMLVHFRKIGEEKALAAVCIFWWIIEDMHIDDYPINKLEVFADDYRCDVDFLKSILEDFDLFRIENDCYVSDRVLRNLKEQEERSEKAKAKAAKRWKGKGENPEAEETKSPEENAAHPEKKAVPQENSLKYNEEFVMSIVQIYNDKFKKSRIVSKANKEKIFKIHTENKLTLDIWEKVFSNAKRGWDIGDKKNVPPSLKKILEEWDSFASDDYFLAPNREAIQKEKEEKELEQEKERNQQKKHKEEFEQSKNQVCDKNTAIEHLNKYFSMSESFLKKSPLVKKYMKKYGFSVKDILKARDETLKEEQESG